MQLLVLQLILTAGSSENHGLTGATATAVASLGLGVDGDNDREKLLTLVG